MKPNFLTGTFATAVILCVAAEASQTVTVTTDVEDQACERVFEAEDTVSVPIYVSSEGAAAIFGVDFTAAVTTDAVRISSVSFNPVFSRTMGRSETALPAEHYHAVRVQPLHSIDHDLGTDGELVHFATVELEVLQAEHFEAALQISAQCALVGAVPESTTVLGVESSSRTPRSGRIDIINTRPIPVWTDEEATLTFHVRSVGGDEPVTVLAPNTTYELHYQASYDRLNDYMLSALAASADQGLAAASPPTEGDWSPPVRFDIDDVPSDAAWARNWDGEGNLLTNIVYDFWLDTDRYAGPEEHLCNFTTGSAGELKLDLFMSWFDVEAYHAAWMRSQAEFAVQEPPAEDDDGAPDGGSSDSDDESSDE